MNFIKKSTFYIFFLFFSPILFYGGKNQNNTFYYALGGEIWPGPETGGHGIALLGYKKAAFPDQAELKIKYNTDTINLEYDHIRINKWEFGIWIKGELFYAGLLSDYYDRGRLLKEGSMNASFIETGTHITFLFNNKNNIRLLLPVKKYFFSRNKNTGNDFFIPSDFWQFAPAFIYTHWQLKNDPSLYDLHRSFKRIIGFAFSFITGLEVRSNAEKWGFTQVDYRRENNFEGPAYYFKEWIAFGFKVLSFLRLEILEQASYSMGRDDISNDRIGGMNPYVIPLAGLPWASIIAGRYLSFQGSLHFLIIKNSEAGLAANTVFVEDIRREGNKRFENATGISVFFDIRIGDWQIDLKGGYTIPADWLKNGPYYSFFLSVGSKFDF